MLRFWAVFVKMFIIGTVALAADAPNLAKPTNKADSWRFETHEQAKGSMKVDGDAIVFEAADPDAEAWHLQGTMTGLELKEGKEYTIKFSAKASAERAVNLNAMIDQDDWHTIGLSEQIDLTKDWKEYTYTFKAEGVVAKKNRISFIVGNEKGTVWVKNLTLTEK